MLCNCARLPLVSVQPWPLMDRSMQPHFSVATPLSSRSSRSVVNAEGGISRYPDATRARLDHSCVDRSEGQSASSLLRADRWSLVRSLGRRGFMSDLLKPGKKQGARGSTSPRTSISAASGPTQQRGRGLSAGQSASLPTETTSLGLFQRTEGQTRNEFRCGACGYGIIIVGSPPTCPMCGADEWEPRTGHVDQR